MRSTLATVRRGALPAAVLAVLAAVALDPFSWGPIGEFPALMLGLAGVVLLAAWGVAALSDDELPEAEFRRLVERSERLAAMPPVEPVADDFEEQVRAAIDALPADLRGVLERVPILISTHGEEYGAYGHYLGDTAARDDFRDQIVIYRDTLERDFGDDPERLRAEVTRTLRHEVAHHLGWDEAGVRGLGL